MSVDSTQTRSLASAQLVAWEDGTPGAAYPLLPQHVTTIGRSPNCDIVLQDDLCSRHHCEIFASGDNWMLRDQGSRNGTFVDRQRIQKDWPLEEGQLIRIGEARLLFTRKALRSRRPTAGQEDTAVGLETSRIIADLRDSKIVDTLDYSRYAPERFGEARREDLGQGLSELYRMALETATARDVNELTSLVLDRLLTATGADIGAVLLLPRDNRRPTPERLQVVAFRSQGELDYEKVSDSLSRLTLEQRQAFLTEDISANSQLQLTQTGSLDEIAARSAICAPIRTQDRTRGLIHLYSTRAAHRLTTDELHFTLAVADHVALVMDALEEKESLEAGLKQAEAENRTLRQQLREESELVGESRSIIHLRQQIEQIAPTAAAVLIRGESGVGKELVARAIHFGSQCRSQPFVCMNCAALTESLLESELFGHEKGSFTGATEQKIGKFEQAHQGTLFLDEVGEMSLNIQSKFLRVLEGHPFERVGGSQPILVDVRVVAATNRNLEEAVQQGQFRRDLYYRLQVVQIEIDPLRQRRSDIPLLARFFMQHFAEKTERSPKRLTPAAIEVLTSYDWPGNIRELQNTIDRSVILCSADELDADDIQLSNLEGGVSAALPSLSVSRGRYREITLESLEQAHILATLDYTEWNKTRAAQILGIERSTLDRKLKRYKVSRPS